MEFIVLIVILIALISLPTLFAYLVYRCVRKTRIRLIGTLCLLLAPLLTIYFIYTAIFPNDDFYFEEYKTATSFDAPKSAVIIKKTATYPDFHGDYISVSIIELSKEDYLSLYTKLIKDKHIDTLGQLVGSKEFIAVVGEKEKLIEHTFTRKIQKSEQGHYSISFLNDRKTVIINNVNF